MMVNKVILIGRVGKDPEIKEFESGNVISNFSLATTESWKDKEGDWQEKTEWHNIVVWRKSNFQKGDLVYIEGKSTNRSYENADGETKYITEIVANVTRMLHRKDGPGASTEGYENNDLDG